LNTSKKSVRRRRRVPDQEAARARSAPRNIPGRYAVILPVKAEAATVSGEASHSRPGPERPL
jgi:hypothetical protein